jgi:hypothetical protein
MHVIRLDFITFEFHDNYVIAELAPDLNVDAEKVDKMIEALREHFGDSPYAYISNRVNDYSLDPTQTRRLITETNLKLAAFVLKRSFSMESLETERMFYNIPIRSFTEIEGAEDWVKLEMAKIQD